MSGDGVIAEITFVKFFEVLGGSLEDAIVKNANSHEVKYMKKNSGKMSKDVSHLKLEDMIFIKKLGFG